MRFKDLTVYPEYRFSVGVDTLTGAFFLAIPVSNQLVDYEEYYSIPREWAETSELHLAELQRFAEACRAHEKDSHLLLQPGSNRGTPV